MNGGDTIVAVGSAPGRGLRALVRVSGPSAFDVVESMGAGPVERRRGVVPVRLRCRGASGELALPALMIAMPGPGSFTGEDTVELLVAGHPTLARRVLEAALVSGGGRSGVRSAAAGEFTARAYLSGRLSLEQAEGLAATIAAESAEELAAAARVLDGAAGAVYRSWSERVLSMLALVEAGVDFSDQEGVSTFSPSRLRQELAALIASIEAALGLRHGGMDEGHLTAVALVGEPNAGKSTLFNRLLGRGTGRRVTVAARAVESSHAGSTRDVLRERTVVRDSRGVAVEVELMDLPGLESEGLEGAGEVAAVGDGAASARAAQASARRGLAGADVLVWCDPTGRFMGDGPAGVGGSKRGEAAVIRVRTKADVPGLDMSGVGPGAGAVAVCALDGANVEALAQAIAEAATGAGAGRGAGRAAGGIVVERHRASCERALACLHAAAGALGAGRVTVTDDADDARGPACGDELLASDVRGALDALGEITGAVMPDDVLGRIFSTFCIGK